MLTKVLKIRRLLDQTINLLKVIKFLAGPEILARQLLLDARQDLQRARVLNFFCFGLVGRRDARSVPTAHQRTHVADVAHDGLATLGGIVGFGR